MTKFHFVYNKKENEREVSVMAQDVVCIANYLLSKDTSKSLFNKNLVRKNGRSFYEGNARLNKYLHLAQNIYIAKTGEKLFSEDLYAYDNGAVAPSVQTNYSILLSRNEVSTLPGDIQSYLDKIYAVFENATLDELIELSHEDSEWVDKHHHYAKADQRMDSLSRVEEYRKQYSDIIMVMDRMTV